MSGAFTPNAIPLVITDNTTISAADLYDSVQATISAAKTLTLYSANAQYAGYSVGAGQGVARGPGAGVLYVYNLNASTANLTVAPASGETMNGTADATVSVGPGTVATFYADGSGWTCISSSSIAGGSQVQTVQVPLTSANILAMSATPVTLIAAPGTGKAIRVLDISLEMTTTSTQYANGGAVEFRYTNGSGTKVTADIASAVITAAAGTSYTSVGGIEASLTMVTNAAIVVTNATAAFITGTGSGIFSITYKVVG